MTFDPCYGEAVAVAPRAVRITARNPGPFTGSGTNSYIIGERTLMIVDPGPDDAAHLAALLAAIAGRKVSHILLTHTHRDHVGGLGTLHDHVGGERLAEGPHRLSRPLRAGEVNPFAASADFGFRPDRALADNETVDNGDAVLRAIATPGHAANHMAFACGEVILTGDHIMGWSTSVIAPPDGSMAAYMASLDRLGHETCLAYLPGHGDLVTEPAQTLSATRSHRVMRERAILTRLSAGDRAIADIVAALYPGLDPRLLGAAGLSVQAHLEKLETEKRAVCDGLGRDATWRPA